MNSQVELLGFIRTAISKVLPDEPEEIQELYLESFLEIQEIEKKRINQVQKVTKEIESLSNSIETFEAEME